MSDPNKCPKCGRRKKPEFDLCYDCSQKGSGYDKSNVSSLPDDCFFESFLNPSGLPKKEIYIDSAEKAAKVFEILKMSQGQIRQAFQMLKSMEMRIRAERDISEDVVNNCFYQFARQIEYQLKRGVIKEQFADFVRRHTDVATKSIPEFKGFVEYLTSIMARMKTK